MSEIKGYYKGSVYMGYVNGTYKQFETEQAYYEYIVEEIHEELEA